MNEGTLINPAKRAFSSKRDIDEALTEIKSALGSSDDFNLVVFFASPVYAPEKLATAFKESFPFSQTVGCTTAGESFGGKLLQDSIVVMAFNQKIVKDFKIEILENLNNERNMDVAINSFQQYFGKENLSEKPEKYVGLIIADGLNMKEERIISRINQLIEVDFIGGSAGDNWKMEKTHIYFNGKAYKNATMLAILEPTEGFKVIKSQSFVPIGKVAKASLVDESKRCLKKIDGKPAGIFYAEQIGCAKEEIDKYFLNYSIGIVIYNDAYAHDIKSIDKDYNMYLYSAIPMGAELQVLKTIDIADSLGEFLAKKIDPLANISAIINFSCGSRFRKIKRDNREKEIEEIWKDYPIVGFGTYGEFYISFINQTSVFLILF